MTLLDRFRTAQRDKHPDPAVRLAYVNEIPLEDRAAIAAMAVDDEDARVRRAAVAKLMDTAALGRIAQADADEGVRTQATSMLRDIALEAFEGLGETEALDAVDAILDARVLGHIAKAAGREIVVLRALSRVTDPHAWGSIARHASVEAVRRGALAQLSERGDTAEVVAIAMNGDFKDVALAAVDLVSDRDVLEQIANRGKNKAAAKRARAILRATEEPSATSTMEPDDDRMDDAVETYPTESSLAESGMPLQADVDNASRESELAAERARAEAAAGEAREAAAERDAREAEAARENEARAEADRQRRLSRLSELVPLVAAAADEPDLAAARKGFHAVRKEWHDLVSGITVDESLTAAFAEAQARFFARDNEAREADAKVRRDALARLEQLAVRAEALVARADLSLKAADRASRDVRDALAHLPHLPTKQDAETITGRLKAAQALLAPKIQELRDADEWQRWANAGVQEQLCAKMETLGALDDPEQIAREVRTLQEQWRKVADVPRAQAEILWHRFKAAHDLVWPRCEAHFAAEAQVRAENLARKTALCEKAESLAESTNWIQTADAIKALQAEWKGIGAVSRGREKAIWERFRSACDRFFTRRHEDLAQRKTVWSENLAKKVALCEKVEGLAQSSDWDQTAAEIRRLQNEWKTIGPVKKSRSEAIWQRFRSACDTFFNRYAQRHDVAKAERVAAREAICAEVEALGADEAAADDLLAKVRTLRSRWQQEIAARGVDPERARALDARFAEAHAAVLTKWPASFAGSELDPDANRKKMEALVDRVEALVKSLAGSALQRDDAAMSPANRLASMLKEALASNTIGGKVDDESRWRAAAEDIRQAQASFARIGLVAEDARRALTDRFHRACRLILDRASGKTGGSGKSGGSGGSGRESGRAGETDRSGATGKPSGTSR